MPAPELDSEAHSLNTEGFIAALKQLSMRYLPVIGPAALFELQASVLLGIGAAMGWTRSEVAVAINVVADRVGFGSAETSGDGRAG